MTGERRWLAIGWAAAAAAVSGVCLVNVFTILHEQPEYGLGWPFVLEGSSAITNIVAAPLAFLVVRWAVRTRPTRQAVLGAHLIAALLYSLLHVGGFVALRRLLAAATGRTYAFGPFAEQFPYELRKDLLAYTLMALIFWVTHRLIFTPAAAAPPPTAPAMFDIRDGARLMRTPLAEILAVTSAGNYAEFILADGRRPLMRSSLAALEADLAAGGFVRTHRSWLVNAGRITGLRPEGSGDYTVEIGELEAPLSRRFPQALARLRGGIGR